MGVFARTKAEKLDPWFCIMCDLEAGTTKLPLEMKNDPYPENRLSDRLTLDSSTSGRLFVRAPSAKIAKIKAKVHLKAYLVTRTKSREDKVAA
jgi:hypothetical protein